MRKNSDEKIDYPITKEASSTKNLLLPENIALTTKNQLRGGVKKKSRGKKEQRDFPGKTENSTIDKKPDRSEETVLGGGEQGRGRQWKR